MTVVLRAVSTPVGTTTDATISVDKPAGTVDGDLMLMAILSNSDSAVPAPPGDWAAVETATGNSRACYVYKKTASSEGANYTVTRNASESYCAAIASFYSDVPKTLYVDAHANQTNASSTNRTYPGVTTTKDSVGILCAGNLSVNTGSTPPGGMTEQWEALAGGNRIWGGTQILTSAGATGDFVATALTTTASLCTTTAVAELTPPTGAPSGLNAVAASTSQINLSWTDNSSNETGFEVERSNDGSSGWTLITTTAADATSYNNTGLGEHVTRYYRVRAVNADGNSAYSSTANATTNISAPTGLGATPASPTSIDLSWTDTSGIEDGFKIERSPNGSSSWVQIATPAANANSHTDSGLSGSTTYYYRIRAYAGGDNSAYSNTASSTTTLNAPTGLAANALSQKRIQLTWTDTNAGENGYSIERSPNGSTGWVEIATTAANAVSYTDSGLASNTTYHYRMRAFTT